MYRARSIRRKESVKQEMLLSSVSYRQGAFPCRFLCGSGGRNEGERERGKYMKLQDLDEELEEEKVEDSEGLEEESLSLSEMALWQKAVIFGILFVIAAVIATILWNLTPRTEDGGRPAGGSQTVQALKPTQLPTAEPTALPTEVPTPEPTAEPTVVPTGEPAAEYSEEPALDDNTESGRDEMGFVKVVDSVTPKDVINLRSNPSTADVGNIVMQAGNGEILNRVGVNHDTGWSRIDYNGQTLYAVSQYLSEDLNYKTPVEVADPNRVSTIDGRVIVFADCDDWITPKEYVNLRTEPSTTEGNATVSCQLNYGEKVHRTGYSADSGWSRVEYNGLVLYVVSSYMYQVTE